MEKVHISWDDVNIHIFGWFFHTFQVHVVHVMTFSVFRRMRSSNFCSLGHPACNEWDFYLKQMEFHKFEYSLNWFLSIYQISSLMIWLFSASADFSVSLSLLTFNEFHSFILFESENTLNWLNWVRVQTVRQWNKYTLWSWDLRQTIKELPQKWWKSVKYDMSHDSAADFEYYSVNVLFLSLVGE